MNKFRLFHPWIQRLIGTVLLVSSFFQFSSPYEFVAKVHAYGLTSPTASIYLAFALPIVQTVLGIGICFEDLSRGASYISSLLFATFATAQLVAFVSGKQINCGCLGEFSFQISGWTIATTFMLCFLAFLSGCQRERE